MKYIYIYIYMEKVIFRGFHTIQAVAKYIWTRHCIIRGKNLSNKNRNCWLFRSYWRCSVKKGVLRNFAKFSGKHLCLITLQALGLRPAPLLKKRLWHSCFPVNFAKFLRTFILQNTSGRLLLDCCWYYMCNVYGQC